MDYVVVSLVRDVREGAIGCGRGLGAAEGLGAVRTAHPAVVVMLMLRGVAGGAASSAVW